MTKEEAQSLVVKSTKFINEIIPLNLENEKPENYNFIGTTSIYAIGEGTENLQYSVNGRLRSTNENDKTIIQVPLGIIVDFFNGQP
jgi:hypothetical protein